MTMTSAILVVLGCGYLALTIMGMAVTLNVYNFVNNAVGREGSGDPPPGYSMLLGLFYSVVYMWAVGLVAMWSGGKTKLCLKRAEQTIQEGGLSPDEVRRLKAACEELEVTSQFRG